MPRLSLRLDDSLLDRTLPHGTASFSVGGGSGRSSRSLTSRRSQQLSVSCSDSLLVLTPRKPSVPSLRGDSVHSAASDASLLSSLLDDSSVQETTLVDSLWGSDHDMDPKESTVIAAHSTALAESTVIGPERRCSKHLVQTLSRVHCKDCDPRTAPPNATGPPSSAAEPSIVYCRSRRRRTGALASVWDAGVNVCGAAAACVTSLLALLRRQCRRATAGSSHCGGMNLTESSAELTERRPAGSLCRTAGEGLRWLGSRWRHVTSSFLLTGFLLRLLLVLLPLLLLLSCLCQFGPVGLWFVLPAVNITERRTLVSDDVPDPSSVYSIVSSQEEAREVLPHEEAPHGRAPPEEEESARAVRLGRSLTALWEQVEAGGRQAEQRHREVLQLYMDLQEQQRRASAPARGEGAEPWLGGLLDQQLTRLRRRLREETQQREQTRQLDLLQQQKQTSRLDQLDLQLQNLAARTEEVQRRQEAASPSRLPVPARPGVDRQSHDALQQEVARLEAALQEVRRDVAALSGFRDGCEHLDRIQETVSAQVREEVRALVYGSRLVLGGGGDPEDLLESLLQRFVDRSDLQEALDSLELRILQNFSLQLEQHRSGEPVGETVPRTAAAGAAVTREDVRRIVKDALRLFSQDQTGLADYALESGGGSVLSTRCSETYETKAALLSLFGVPLWYFSQSPRAVIQPDVHPGNCWAFRGSTGFLVIRLSTRILPTAFSLEHIPRALAPSGTLRSAPRDFSVYGLEDESQERGKLLGSYTYDKDGEALQTNAVSEENDRVFQIIEVRVLSNWGHPEYTCMYRFRVHGTPADA